MPSAPPRRRPSSLLKHDPAGRRARVSARRGLGALRGLLLRGEQGRLGGGDGLVQRVLGGVAAEDACASAPQRDVRTLSRGSASTSTTSSTSKASFSRLPRRGPRLASRPAGRRRRAPRLAPRPLPRSAWAATRSRSGIDPRARTRRRGGRRRRSCGVSGPGACLAALPGLRLTLQQPPGGPSGELTGRGASVTRPRAASCRRSSRRGPAVRENGVVVDEGQRS